MIQFSLKSRECAAPIFQKQESSGMTLADMKTWTMILNQTVTYVEMANLEKPRKRQIFSGFVTILICDFQSLGLCVKLGSEQ